MSSGPRAQGSRRRATQGPQLLSGPFLAEPRATSLASFLGELQDRNWGAAPAPPYWGQGHPPAPGSGLTRVSPACPLAQRGTELAGAGRGGGGRAPPSPGCLYPRDHGFLQGRLSLLTLAPAPRHQGGHRFPGLGIASGLARRPGPKRASPTFCPGGPLWAEQVRQETAVVQGSARGFRVTKTRVCMSAWPLHSCTKYQLRAFTFPPVKWGSNTGFSGGWGT